MSTAAEVIRSQINPMVLMSLGASELVSTEANEGRPALAFWRGSCHSTRKASG